MATASDYETVVQQLYVAYFGRPADPMGLAAFEAQFNANQLPTTINGLSFAYSKNASIKAFVDGFGTSAESMALYGSGSTFDFVTHIYQSVLGRNPDLSGALYWSSLIDSGNLTKGAAALQIAAAAATNQGSDDLIVFMNKVTAASLFTQQLDTTKEILAYTGLAASDLARNMLNQVKLNSVTNLAITTSVNAVVDLANPPAQTHDMWGPM